MKPYDSAQIDLGLALLPSSMYKQVFPKRFKKSCYTFPMDLFGRNYVSYVFFF